MRKALSTTVSALTLMLALTACGGNDGYEANPPPVPNTPSSGDDIPVSATASSQAYASFANGLVASESAAPLDISVSVPPTSETAEPLAI